MSQTTSNIMSIEVVLLAEHHVRDILTLAIQHTSDKTALVVFDTECPLAITLT